MSPSFSQPESNGGSQTVIGVFCGASSGNCPTHIKAARDLAQTLYQRYKSNLRVCYGGGSRGIMGTLASELVSLCGPSSVHGIIPEKLVNFERPDASSFYPNNSAEEYAKQFGKLTIVDGPLDEAIHTRKRLLYREVMGGGPGSGFIALSGGYGTLEELWEVGTWSQLGFLNKGVVVFNVKGYFDGLIQWKKEAVDQGFVKGSHMDILQVATTAEQAVEMLRDHQK